MSPPTDGISRTLARERAANIGSVRYDLTLSIPEKLQEPVQGRVGIRFRVHDPSPVILDFAQPAASVQRVSANGRAIEIRLEHGHLVVPANAVSAGENTLEVAFTAGNDALNRNAEFLYSLFVPAHASQTFPCFDQPDIKALFSLTLEVPLGWAAVSNGRETERHDSGTRTTVRFGDTQALPTYLFGFAAGRFTLERGERNGRSFNLYHRETDAEKVAANRDAIFDLHSQALEWMEDYTARKYPFDKLDFVIIPAFQFSGMEHAGAIFYNASMFLEPTATQEQRLSRASTIAHETAHMWFGDLVTMEWFDDVWLKEVFANFMAGKIVNPSFPGIDHELRFLLQHYPSAYAVDRTAGANPIRQPLENLNDAGSLYGSIIYDKAPIVMRQLEEMLGPESLREGLREYLTRYAFGNATWSDLIDILDARTDEDLAAWSRVWVDEPGRPTISTELQTDESSVRSVRFRQTDPAGSHRLWTQQLQVALGYQQGARISPLRLQGATGELRNVQGLPLPRYVLPNGEGTGYGLFKLDKATTTYLLSNLPGIGDAVTRASAWMTLWDGMLEGEIRPRVLLELALRALPLESEEQNVQRIVAYATRIYWTFLSDGDRAALSADLEATLSNGIRQSAQTSLKSTYFTAFRTIATSPEALGFLERIWKQQEAIVGLPFSEPDYIAMAEELALRGVADAPAILDAQKARIKNPDRLARFEFVRPSLSSDEAVRDTFFASLARRENRAHEPWVVDAVAYLNHPLRRRHAERYIEPSLSLLAEIQRTGDIFFPSRWMLATLEGHNSPAAAGTVADFLKRQNDYPLRLRRVVLQASDLLDRSARILGQE